MDAFSHAPLTSEVVVSINLRKVVIKINFRRIQINMSATSDILFYFFG